MEPLFDKLARLKIPDRFVRFVIGMFLSAEPFIRIILIVGAAACLVIGGKRIAEAIVYHIDVLNFWELLITALPFIPIILLAPKSATHKKPVLLIFVALLEILVIVSNLFMVLR
jgi:hypothetical protein